MTRENLLNSIVADLGANYREDDSNVLGALLDEVINDALFISNRLTLSETDLDSQLSILSSNIRQCVKSIYLQRGAEDVNSQSEAGLSSSYENSIERMKSDIIRSGKRLVR